MQRETRQEPFAEQSLPGDAVQYVAHGKIPGQLLLQLKPLKADQPKAQQDYDQVPDLESSEERLFRQLSRGQHTILFDRR